MATCPRTKALADPTASDNGSLSLEFAHVLFDEVVSTSSEHALAPFLDKRRKQGYKTREATMAESMISPTSTTFYRALCLAIATVAVAAPLMTAAGPAEARWRGAWRGYGYGGGWGHGYYGRPYGHYGYGWRRPYYGYGGGAVAAGLIGGLALGSAIAAPRYYGYGWPGYYGADYVPSRYYWLNDNATNPAVGWGYYGPIY
jgi:hypothetical protein